MSYNKIKEYILKNKEFLILYIISTIFFILYHYIYMGWDFAAYVINAKYWLGLEQYFETYRAPLMPFTLMIFGASKFAEYIYIFLISSLFAIACYKFSKTVKLNEILFYAFMLNPFTLLMGLIEGTELLSLTLLLFSITLILNNKNSGYMFGLAFLCKYTNLYNAIFIFFDRKKNIIKNIITFAIIIAAWFIFNYINYGNFFTSIANGYALNVKFRDYLPFVWGWSNFLILFNIIFPFLIYGIYKRIKQIKIKPLQKIDWILIIYTIIQLYIYFSVPVKVERYLFNLILPVVYYSTYGINELIKNKSNINVNKYIAIISIIIILIISISTTIKIDNNSGNSNPTSLKIINIAKSENITHCALKTNTWVEVNYLSDINVAPTINLDHIDMHIKEGYIMILAQNISHKYKFYSKNGYSAIGKKKNCKLNKNHKHDMTYLERIQIDIKRRYNETENIEPCHIIFNNQILKKICEKINFQ